MQKNLHYGITQMLRIINTYFNENVHQVFDSGVKQSPIPAISRRSLRGGEELARDLVEEEEEVMMMIDDDYDDYYQTNDHGDFDDNNDDDVGTGEEEKGGKERRRSGKDEETP